MIELQVKDYCQNCIDFEPEVSKFYGENWVYLQTVQCVNKERCENVYQAAIEKARMEVQNEHNA